jgi:hypothetical protein
MNHYQFVRDYLAVQAVQFVVCAAATGYQYYLLRRDRGRWAAQDAAREAKLLGEESRYSGTSQS